MVNATHHRDLGQELAPNEGSSREDLLEIGALLVSRCYVPHPECTHVESHNACAGTPDRESWCPFATELRGREVKSVQ